MKPVLPALLAALIAAAACSPAADAPDAAAPAAPGEAAAAGDCPDDGPRFPGTGLCIGRSVNYMDPEMIAGLGEIREGCSWEPNETMLPGDEAILYLAATCNGVKTELEFRGGARSAAFGYVRSGFYDSLPADFEPVRLFTLDGFEDDRAGLMALIRESTENKEEAAACEIQEAAATEGLTPKGSITVDVSDAYKAARPGEFDEVYAVCGPYGYSTDTALKFWMLRHGYGWFVDYGQDFPDVAPGSITLIRKGADGAWETVP